MKRFLLVAFLLFAVPAIAEDYQEHRDQSGNLTGYVCIDPAGCGGTDPTTGCPAAPYRASIPLSVDGNCHAGRVAGWIAAGNTARPAPPSALVTPAWNGTAWVEGTDAMTMAQVAISEGSATIEAAGWTPGELTRRLSGGLAILSRVILAVVDGVTPEPSDVQALRDLEPQLARYELPAASLVGTVKELADARAEIAAAAQAGRRPNLANIKKPSDLK